ncbi:hypothetical protein [Spirosoma pollinicola]|uniref:Pectate lyase superfamily protein domain-containing protein n=1 Tax=Spirosoma pollinicola TaxID=2057025 RepID=A0A2K8YTG4_9BACT|nr:hypothetical protein [Spirosoma pollinicola]AUD00925.1 hypothetical protein CWM47_03305 [Spirosoma pollinicola]
MSRYLLHILLLLTALPGLAQLGPSPKNSGATGIYNLGRRADGILTERGKTGTATPVAITPYMSLTSLRANSSLAMPVSINLTDKYRQGTFVYDPTDTSTPDNGGTVLVTASNMRFKLVHNGEVPITQFGAIPNDNLDDTDALRRALSSNVPLLVPNGLYEANDSLAVINTGSMRIRGQSPSAAIRMNADKNLLVFTSNAAGGGIVDIRDLTLIAGVDMTTGAAIKLRGGYAQKLGSVTGVTISRFSPAHEWKFGIWCQNPLEFVQKDNIMRGNGQSKFIGSYYTSSLAAVSPTLDNVKVYDAKTGVSIVSASQPGIEGVKLRGCDFVGVSKGLDATSTIPLNSYVPPGIQLTQCHINAIDFGVAIENYVQIGLSDNIIYLNSISTTIGTNLYNVAQVQIHNNQYFRVGSGTVYGIVASFGLNLDMQISSNLFSMKPSGVEQAIWLGPGTTYSTVINNTTSGLGGNSYTDTVNGGVLNQGSNNTITGNVRRN